MSLQIQVYNTFTSFPIVQIEWMVLAQRSSLLIELCFVFPYWFVLLFPQSLQASYLKSGCGRFLPYPSLLIIHERFAIRRSVLHIKLETNSIEENPSSEARSPETGQYIPSLIRSPKVHYHVHNIPQLGPILYQLIRSYTFVSCFSKISVVLMLSSHLSKFP
jgi:hypothetical protein